MAKIIEVTHRGISLRVRKLTAVKKGTKYTEYQIVDYSTGKRVRHSRASLEEAKVKAEEIAEAIVAGKREVLEWDEGQRASIRQALKLLDGAGVSIDRVASIFADAVKFVDANDIVAACRHWRDNGPNKPFKPKLVSEALAEFQTHHRGKIGNRRRKTLRSYLNTFDQKFGQRTVHEITPIEITDFAKSKTWQPNTRNAWLGAVSLFFADAVDRGYCRCNVAETAVIKRQKVRTSDVGILTPDQARGVFNKIEDELKAGLALWCFGGIRIAEIARLSWEQIDGGLASGSIYLPGKVTKTGRPRSVPIVSNLREWLIRYRKPTGSVLPFIWTTDEGLDHLARHLRCKAKFWVKNGPRHSFGTYHLKLHGDPALTIRVMGNSLKELDEHYSSRSEGVTRSIASEWFNIYPSPTADILPMPWPEPALETTEPVLAGVD